MKYYTLRMHFRVLLLCLFSAESAKILGVFHVPTQSHYILGNVLFKALADRGHEVTFVSSFPPKYKLPNMKEIQMQGLDAVTQVMSKTLANAHNISVYNMMGTFVTFARDLTEGALEDERMQKLIHSGQTFDAVVVDAFLNDAHFGLAQHFNASLIVFSSTGSWFVNEYMGNVAPFAIVPSLMSNAPAKMNFAERLLNTVLGFTINIVSALVKIPAQRKIYEKYFPAGPDFSEVHKSPALALMNTHSILESPRPYLLNMIPVAGLHVLEPKKLPEDLQKFMDGAKEGVILFSLGSNLKSSDLPNEKLKSIMKTFRKLRMKVLWKFEKQDLVGKPDNVLMSNWLPQTDLLAHPNMKIFITHGGLLSTIEALYRGVPVVVIPFYGDQKSNAQSVVQAGHGLQLDFQDLDEYSFTKVIEEITNNPKYGQTVKQRSVIFRDQPIKPLDNAVFWVEHVIKHGGAHLRSASADINLAQYLLLDVLAVLFGTASLLLFITYKLFSLICYRSKDNGRKKIKSKKA